ncbi:SCP-like protein [Ancylostoma ceylanicum]|uniref:SCP-like protein n=1 Tax=Ancylostoma ceylanicum TaxID=53326 RepID=A0A0D6LT30_9BILA|nr:SCP-like protein [Ancylostoma ceylanicum]
MGLLDFQCWNFKSTDTLRDQYLKSINNLRKKIVEAAKENKNGTAFPEGTNYYKLNWDCELELKAQEAVDQCKLDATAPAEYSQLIKNVASTCNPTKVLKNSIPDWWNNDVQKTGVDNPPLNKQGLEAFAKLANGKATKIGCAQKNCNEQLYVSCVVNEPAPATGAAIYEVGTACTANDQCTTYLDSKCKNKRDDWEQYRSQLAQGFVKMRNGNARQASKMRRMTYDCPAEASAHSSAAQCRNAAASSANYDENFYAINSNTIEHNTAAREAANTWGLEISTRTMPQGDTERNMYSSSLGIPNFANMVWETHSGVGCAIVRCSTRTNIVCHYSPKSMGDNRQIYKMGPTCRRCHDYPGTRCVDGLCTP